LDVLSINAGNQGGAMSQNVETVSTKFTDVFQEYQRPIYNYLLRMTQNQAEAEDLAQETFIRVHRGLPSFRGDSSLSTWIYRIATNTSFDHFRRASTRRAESSISLEGTQEAGGLIPDSNAPTPELLADQAEMSACVQRFIRELQPSYRAAIILSDLQGLKNREIAEVLEVSLDTVKVRLHRARKKLRAALDSGCDFTHDERNVFVCEEVEG
jgi:RNA polymerase sigma-70 factor (ECF subfamily)